MLNQLLAASHVPNILKIAPTKITRAFFQDVLDDIPLKAIKTVQAIKSINFSILFYPSGSI